MLNFKAIDKSWTLFLDRDGVINRKIDNDYVRNLNQFEMLNGAADAISGLSKIFSKVIIVTNQQGIGKGLMTENDLNEIHQHLKSEIEIAGGKIDAIYFAPNLKLENSPIRKPETGMALAAQKDFPEIEFSKSVMIGDSMHDMDFGKRLGMNTIYISPIKISHAWIDDWAESLAVVANRF